MLCGPKSGRALFIDMGIIALNGREGNQKDSMHRRSCNLFDKSYLIRYSKFSLEILNIHVPYFERDIILKKYIQKFNLLSTYEKLYYILLFILIVSILPILYMGFFAHPVGDDYTYGMKAHLAWEQTGSLFNVLKAAVTTARTEWYSYQGPYASAFFMALQPAVISERLYCLTPFIMLFMLILSTSIFLRIVFVNFLHIPVLYKKITACILLLLSIQLLDTPSEAFFWYCGAVHYVFMHSCMLLFFSALLMAAHKTKLRLLFVFASLPLAVCCGGANFTTALFTIVILCTAFCILLFFRKIQELFIFLPAFLVNIIAFTTNIIAPGNMIREEDLHSSFPPAKAIYYAFQYGLEYLGKWTNIYVFIALLLLVPVAWASASYLKVKLRLPGLFTFFSYCILSSMFAPLTYALGVSLVFGRTLNIIMQTFYLLLILNLFYWTGWLRQNLEALNPEPLFLMIQSLKQIFKKHQKVFALSLSFFLLFATVCTNRASITSKSAVCDLWKGYPQAYHRETLNRISLLTMEGVDEVWVPNYTVRPALLDLEDITTDPEHWRNQSLAQWYGIKTLHLSEIY